MNSLPPITLEDGATTAAIIGLGSNLASRHGSPALTLRRAIEELQAMSTRPARASRLHETEPVDCSPGTPRFINAVAIIHRPLESSPEALLEQLHALELRYGRVRTGEPNEARTLDLDLLCFGALQCNRAGLTLPHPQAHQRRFVLQPLAEIAPELRLPGQSLCVRELLDNLPAGRHVDVSPDRG